MKKFLIATGISIMVLSGCAYSQQTGNKNNKYLNDVNIRAMRDFASRFEGVTNEVWHSGNGSFIVVFTRDSMQYRVIYNNRGYLNYIMKYYEEPQLARDVRAQVKSTYYDYKIFIVQEIETPDNPTVYIFNLRGDTDWKKIILCQGELKVMEEFQKGIE